MVPIITGAPSLVGYEDDCCISYTVTIVDVRSCTRCTRVPVGQQLPHEQQGMCCSYQQCRLLHILFKPSHHVHACIVYVCAYLYMYKYLFKVVNGMY